MTESQIKALKESAEIIKNAGITFEQASRVIKDACFKPVKIDLIIETERDLDQFDEMLDATSHIPLSRQLKRFLEVIIESQKR
jgi:hypothetical protein